MHYQATHSVDNAVFKCKADLEDYTKVFKFAKVDRIFDKLTDWHTTNADKITSECSKIQLPVEKSAKSASTAMEGENSSLSASRELVTKETIVQKFDGTDNHFGLVVLGMLRYYRDMGRVAYFYTFGLTADEDADCHLSWHLFKNASLWSTDVADELSKLGSLDTSTNVYQLVPVYNEGSGLCFFYALQYYAEWLGVSDKNVTPGTVGYLREKVFSLYKKMLGDILPSIRGNSDYRHYYAGVEAEVKAECERKFKGTLVAHPFIETCGVYSFEDFVVMFCEDYYPKADGITDVVNSALLCYMVEKWREDWNVRVVMFSFGTDTLNICYRRPDSERKVGSGDKTIYICYNGSNGPDGHYWAMRVMISDEALALIDVVSTSCKDSLSYWNKSKYTKITSSSRIKRLDLLI